MAKSVCRLRPDLRIPRQISGFPLPISGWDSHRQNCALRSIGHPQEPSWDRMRSGYNTPLGSHEKFGPQRRLLSPHESAGPFRVATEVQFWAQGGHSWERGRTYARASE
jgi:hypothetical protein